MGDLQWWCVARGEPWSWTWRPHPGVWLFIATLAFFYWTLVRDRVAAAPASAPRGKNYWRTASAVAGFVLLWITLDWPVAALGAGYLAGVHSMQFLMLAMIVPALLLCGI